MNWDGSFLGTYTNKNILSRVSICWYISIPTFTGWVERHKDPQGMAPFINKLKTYFGLVCRPCHLIRIARTNYCIYPLNVNELGQPLLPLTLRDFVKDQQANLYRAHIARVFIFKDLLGLNRNTPNNILCYGPNLFSTRADEKTVNSVHDTKTFTDITIKRWFTDPQTNEDYLEKLYLDTFNQAVATYVPKAKDLTLEEKITCFCSQLLYQIEQYNKELSWWPNLVQDILNNRLKDQD